MKIFLIWADKGPEFRKFMDQFESAGHEIVYWVGSTGGEKDKSPRTIFHDHFEAWDGRPSLEIDENSLLPVGKEIIEKFYHTESHVLTMMNKRFDTMPVDARKHLYYKMLSYWYGVIKKYQPEVIIFPTVPHTVYNFIIYDIARRLNIRTIMFEDTWVLDHLLVYEDWKEGSKTLAENMKKNRDSNFSVNDLGDDLKKYYLEQTNPERDSTPIYMEHWRKKHSGINVLISKFKILIKSIKDGDFFNKFSLFIIKKFKPNLKREYKRFVSSIDLDNSDDDFIYIPLNFQPERTTSPQGDVFVDQILMIEILSSSLPNGWNIYVKEHPSQWWLRSGINYSTVRYKGYYERLSKIPHVRIVPIHMDSFKLINKCKAVATVTGTAGWESLLRLKPTIIFGYPWYRDCPEVFRVSDPESAQKVLKKISEGHTVDRQGVLNFLKSIQDTAIRGYIEGFVDKISKINRRDNFRNLNKVIVDWMDNK